MQWVEWDGDMDMGALLVTHTYGNPHARHVYMQSNHKVITSISTLHV